MPRIEAWTICFFLARDSFVWYRMALRLRHLFLGMKFSLSLYIEKGRFCFLLV